MESTQNGRAIVEEAIGQQITLRIPARRNWFILIFLTAWLGGWAMGESFALSQVFKGGMPGGVSAFLAFWLVGWTVGGIFVMQYLVWTAFGEEVITIDRQTLRIEKRLKLFFQPQTFALADCQQFRVEHVLVSGTRGRTTETYPISFDYGLKTIRFASELDRPENEYLLKMLVEKRWLKPEQVGQGKKLFELGFQSP